MDFNVSADPPHVVEFRKEVGAWLAEQFKGHEHLRWSASWSTREDADEYKFRRGLAEKLGAKGWLFPLYEKKYGGAELTIDHQMVLETELFKYGLNLSHTFYTLARIVAPVLIRWG
ncbi:MAG: acyl-CoA dehydrogenase family protein, partial [Candidatus Binatia bacterium]